MNEQPRTLLTAIAPVTFAGLYFASLFGVMDLPETDYGDAEVIALYADADKRLGNIVGVYFLAAAGVAFLVFLASLRDAARIGRSAQSWLATLALAGGVIYCAMLFAAAAAFGVVPLAVAVGGIDAAAVDADLARMFWQLGYVLLLVFGLVAAAVMVVAASLDARTTGALPRWLAWAGLPLAALLLLGPAYMPQFLVPLWTVAVGIALRRGGTTTAAVEAEAVV